MKREYKVVNVLGSWCVVCLIYNEMGEVLKKKFTDFFPSFQYEDAIKKAELGNFIIKKATESFKEMINA